MKLYNNRDNSPEKQIAELRHALVEWNKALDNYTRQYREIELMITTFSSTLKTLKSARNEAIFTLETLLDSMPSTNIFSYISAKELKAHTKILKEQSHIIKMLLSQLPLK